MKRLLFGLTAALILSLLTAAVWWTAPPSIPQCQRDGASARARGDSPDDCPYLDGDRQMERRDAWLSGYGYYDAQPTP